MAPQRDGTLLWNYFNGMSHLEAAHLCPDGMPKNEAKDEALRADLALEQEQQQALPAWNSALNGVYEGMGSFSLALQKTTLIVLFFFLPDFLI
jgi:hypothetical protein